MTPVRPRAARAAAFASLLALFAAAPATRPAAEDPIEFADGALAMPVPDGWHVHALADDGLGAVFLTDAGTYGATGGMLTVGVTPQKYAMNDDPKIADAIGKAVVEQLRQSLAAGGQEVLTAPHLERDPDWFIRVRDVTRDPKSGKVADRLHVFRPVGVYLVMSTATAYDPPAAADADAVHAAAEKAVYQVRPAKAQRNAGVPTKGQPTLLPKAKLKLSPAKEWLETKTDAGAGTVIVYRKPLGPTLVAVRAEPMDKQPDAKDAAARRVAAEELAKYRPPGTEPAGEPESSAGGGALVKLTQRATKFGRRYRVEARVVAVGDPAAGLTLVAITNASPEAAADEASKMADALAATAAVFKVR